MPDAVCSYSFILNYFCRGHIQWFYFSASNSQISNGRLRVRLNIRNLMKKDSLYQFGMRPVVFSVRDYEQTGKGWSHAGVDICYFQTRDSYQRKRGEKRRPFSCVSFVYEFKHENDVVYFAHCYPYTYTMLQHDLKSLEEHESCKHFLKRRLLCETLSGSSLLQALLSC